MTEQMSQEALDEAINIGEFRTERRNNPEYAFLVTRVYIRRYKDGNERLRVDGVKTGRAGIIEDDLDAQSVVNMYPFVKFRAPREEDNEDK